MKKFSLLLLIGMLGSSCSSQDFSSMDRSVVNSKIMDQNTYSMYKTHSPHTGLRQSQGLGSQSCSTCIK